MQDYKRGSHTIWDCKYHLVWVTKYRYPILVGDVGQRARELLREIARSHEMTIYAGAINRDHVHMLISIPSQLSISRGVQFLKVRVHTSFFRSIRRFGSGIGASIYGRAATGWRRVATLQMRSGNNILRTRNPRSRMTTSRLCRLIGPKGRLIRLLAVTRSHRL